MVSTKRMVDTMPRRSVGQSVTSLRSVVNGLGLGRDFRVLARVAGRRVPTAGGEAGGVSRPQGSAWALRCRAFSGSPRARG
jgi:hypothetical protein